MLYENIDTAIALKNEREGLERKLNRLKLILNPVTPDDANFQDKKESKVVVMYGGDWLTSCDEPAFLKICVGYEIAKIEDRIRAIDAEIASF